MMPENRIFFYSWIVAYPNHHFEELHVKDKIFLGREKIGNSGGLLTIYRSLSDHVILSTFPSLQIKLTIPHPGEYTGLS